MPIKSFGINRLLSVSYTPHPGSRSFMERAEVQSDEGVEVEVAVLDAQESKRFFGVPMARRGIQPVWLHITNKDRHPYRLLLVSLDPHYFSALEAAFVNHFATGKRLAAFGLLGWLYLPLLVLLPLKYFGARRANQRMNAFFQEHSIGWGSIMPGSELSGFVFTSLDAGTKEVRVRVLGGGGEKVFLFSIPVPGLAFDYRDKRFDEYYRTDEMIECNGEAFRLMLEHLPRATMNKKGRKEGDPLNLVVVGTFETVLNAFAARWDETETVSLATSSKTVKAFLFGSKYRYSPVSPLYVCGRSQDFALQRSRETINERLHLRLWYMPMRYEGKPVWVGQVSRDIGVRFTFKTWNLTTHKIDPDVDEARDYVLSDLIETGRVSRFGLVRGVEAADRSAPRRNLTGDPYFTDGMRMVAILSETRTEPRDLGWV